MTPRQKKITEKILSLIDWLESQMPISSNDLVYLNNELNNKLQEIKLESFAAEQLECDHKNHGYGVTKFGAKYFYCFDCKQFYNDWKPINNK